MSENPPIRNAATLIVIRRTPQGPSVLMGQRGAKAVFMPSKFVFPGGAVDAGDADLPVKGTLGAQCRQRLAAAPLDEVAPATLAAAAIRELWEETGLRLATTGDWPGPVPEDWQSFAEGGHLPDASGLQFFFRAITPPGRPRRFDARFFLVEAHELTGDADDFSAASDELSHLQWIPLERVREFDLPFITEVVLAEVVAALDHSGPLERVPFYDNRTNPGRFIYLS